MALRVAVGKRKSREGEGIIPGVRSGIGGDALPVISDAVVAVPGQVLIETDRDKEGGLSFIKGHGTYQVEDEDGGEMGSVRLCACNAGIVERVNKLITVRPPKCRYQGQIGDLVVGRVVEVGIKRWKVDIRAVKDAALQLSAVILPDGMQRIRGHEDQLQMRKFYQEDDVISAEVQNVHADGTVHLHTRTVRYGKLENGLLVYVRPALIRRSKHHFLALPIGVDVVLGNNGYVWITRPQGAGDDTTDEDQLHMGKAEVVMAQKKRHACASTTAEERLRIARVRNALVLLNQAFLTISGDTILRVYQVSEQMGLAAKDLLSPSGARSVIAHLVSHTQDDDRMVM